MMIRPVANWFCGHTKPYIPKCIGALTTSFMRATQWFRLTEFLTRTQTSSSIKISDVTIERCNAFFRFQSKKYFCCRFFSHSSAFDACVCTHIVWNSAFANFNTISFPLLLYGWWWWWWCAMQCTLSVYFTFSAVNVIESHWYDSSYVIKAVFNQMWKQNKTNTLCVSLRHTVICKVNITAI